MTDLATSREPRRSDRRQALRRSCRRSERRAARDVAESVISEGRLRAARIADKRFEDLEPRPARRSEMAAQNAARDRRALTCFEGGDRLQTAPVLVPEQKPIQQVFDRDEPNVREVGGATRPDTLEGL